MFYIYTTTVMPCDSLVTLSWKLTSRDPVTFFKDVENVINTQWQLLKMPWYKILVKPLTSTVFFVEPTLILFAVQNSWETVGKKRSIGKEGGTSDLKESREKKGEREVSRGRGASNRRGRGISRGREGMKC